MGRKDYDFIPVIAKVPKGKKLTLSKRHRGAVTPMVHGRRGITDQAVLLPDNARKRRNSRRRGRSLQRRFVAFVGRGLLRLALVGAGLVAALGVLAVVLGGLGAALQTVLDVIAANSAVLQTALGFVVLVGLALAIFTILRAVWRANSRDAERKRQSAGAAEQPMMTLVAPAPPALPGVPAGWYPDPVHVGFMRYWDGLGWTPHLSGPALAPAPAVHYPDPMPSGAVPMLQQREHSLRMTTAQWQAHVQAWALAGAAQQALWDRISHALITDADPQTLELQQQMERLNPQQVDARIRRALGANPTLGGNIDEFVRTLLQAVGRQPMTLQSQPKNLAAQRRILLG